MQAALAVLFVVAFVAVGVWALRASKNDERNFETSGVRRADDSDEAFHQAMTVVERGMGPR